MKNKKMIIGLSILIIFALCTFGYTVNKKYKETSRKEALSELRDYKLNDSEYTQLKDEKILNDEELIMYSSNSDLMINDQLIESDINDIKSSLDKVYLQGYTKINKKMIDQRNTYIEVLKKLKTKNEVDTQKKEQLLKLITNSSLKESKNISDNKKLKDALLQYNEQALIINDINQLEHKLNK